MSTATLTTAEKGAVHPTRGAITPIPFRRLVTVELRKMFDTRAGFWLMASIALLALAATAAVIVWGPDSTAELDTFSSAIGIPMAILLPVIAVLTVTSEYSQRTALTTYTLEPRRARVLAAKLVSVVAVGLVAMLIALAVGSLGLLVAGAVNDVDPAWNTTVGEFAKVVLGNILGMLMGFMLGVVLRSSPAAIVAYFVYSLVLPGVSGMLAAYQEWYRDVQPWVDPQLNITQLYDYPMTGETWTQLGVTMLVWLVLPLAVGSWALLRAEVK